MLGDVVSTEVSPHLQPPPTPTLLHTHTLLTHPSNSATGFFPSLPLCPQAALVRAWVPELAALQPAELSHTPWEASPEALAAAGVVLGEAGSTSPGSSSGGGGGGGVQSRSYPPPLVDPATQLAKGPRRQEGQGQQQERRRRGRVHQQEREAAG